jgi:predicted Zn-dependent protease with MMP-like domain
MDRRHFEELAAEAVEDLPAFFRRRLDNVAIVVEEAPTPELLADGGLTQEDAETLLGLYVGTPLEERSVLDTRMHPDMIYLFQKNIEAICETEEEIRHEIRATVIHELGHYFGIQDEERLP